MVMAVATFASIAPVGHVPPALASVRSGQTQGFPLPGRGEKAYTWVHPNSVAAQPTLQPNPLRDRSSVSIFEEILMSHRRIRRWSLGVLVVLLLGIVVPSRRP